MLMVFVALLVAELAVWIANLCLHPDDVTSGDEILAIQILDQAIIRFRKYLMRDYFRHPYNLSSVWMLLMIPVIREQNRKTHPKFEGCNENLIVF